MALANVVGEPNLVGFGSFLFLISILGGLSLLGKRSTQSPSVAVNSGAVNPTDTATIAALQQQCEALRQELDQQRHLLHTDFRQSTFEQLQTLLVYFPTARRMAQAQPDLPARQLIALFLPLEHWLEQAGIEAIGSVWEQVPYDPQRHEAEEKDLTVGELVYIRFVGYQMRGIHQDGMPDPILCPAKVSRTLPVKLGEADGERQRVEGER